MGSYCPLMYKRVIYMLIYSTRFRVTPEFSKSEFVKNIADWNKESSYPIADIEENSFSFIAGDDDRNIEVTELAEKNIIAARIHISNNGGEWDTDLILNYGTAVISVYVNRTVADSTVNISSRGGVPNFVSQIIERGFAGKCCGLDITSKAICISDKEILEAAVSTSDRYSLPIVYLSSTAEINADKLAEKLAGLAVVVSDSESVLKDTYPDPIYVFFPHRNTPPVSFGAYPYHREIQWIVYDYLNRREYEKLESWDGIQNEKIASSGRNALTKLRDVCADNEALIDMCCELEKRIDEESDANNELNREIGRLRAENARLMNENERMRENGRPLIMYGKEEDLYADEQREIIMEIISDYRKNTADDTRRADIIDSVVKANPVKGIPEKNKKIIKQAIDGYTNFDTTKINQALAEVGIEIIAHGKHYKIALNGDHRYVCEAAATCSDSGRGGKNLVSEINKKMF